ncbi:hypothetical protein [Kamptonema formosum]|uniref:hypothetical protein n=1 Tax=Kamptonema formosum TaxID=331992 RepID=UPI0003479CD9|nr:hypothetical protein [Oscillatoria sp. PCC 10802]
MKEASFLRALRQRSSLAALLKSPQFWLAVALLSCLLLCFFEPLNLLAFAVATVRGLSGAVFPIAGGAVFGLLWGTLRSVVGATQGAVGAFWVAPSGASRVVQICRNQCDNDLSRRQEKNLFCQMNPGNGIETTWPGVTGFSALQGGERLPFFYGFRFFRSALLSAGFGSQGALCSPAKTSIQSPFNHSLFERAPPVWRIEAQGSEGGRLGKHP